MILLVIIYLFFNKKFILYILVIMKRLNIFIVFCLNVHLFMAITNIYYLLHIVWDLLFIIYYLLFIYLFIYLFIIYYLLFIIYYLYIICNLLSHCFI